ncbi:MAG: SecE/Sec61-gamma subunit of protein translocation complex [Solirubrobacterales bacterium]|nr:SecE/Sec61-gamma subunit of protein translocation complex [Solirubrobacterales bacterium]
MAKSRAQRKAEQRKRQARGETAPRPSDTQAQHDTQVPETADVAEAELAERGVNLDELRGAEAEQAPEAPAPSRSETAPASEKTVTRREQKRIERERRDAAKASVERRKPREVAPPRERGRVMAFFASCIAELRRVQWPTRETLIQASAVTIVFIAVAAAYLGVLDAAFNWLIQRII